MDNRSVRRFLGAAVTLAALAAMSSGASAVPIRVDAHALKNAKTVTKDLVVPGNGDNTVGDYLKCPAGTRILTGGAAPSFAEDPHTVLDNGRVSDSSPTFDGKGWYADVGTFNGSGLTVTEHAYCLPKHRLADVVLRKQRYHAAPAGSTGGYASCPHDARVLSGGAFWESGHAGPDQARADDVALWSSSPTNKGRRWFASGYNASAEKLNLTVVARCLPKAELGQTAQVAFDQFLEDGEIDAGSDGCVYHGHLVPTLSVGSFWHSPGQGPNPTLAYGANLAWSSVVPSVPPNLSYPAVLSLGLFNQSGGGLTHKVVWWCLVT
jgi:hypothetical protein